MTTPTRINYAEALQLPRRLLLQDQLAAVGFVPGHPDDDDHRTWLELAAADVTAHIVAEFEGQLAGAIEQSLRSWTLHAGGFLADRDQREAAIRAALVGAAAAIIQAATS